MTSSMKKRIIQHSIHFTGMLENLRVDILSHRRGQA